MLKKKIISALLAGITALSLTACGGNTSQADVNTSGSAETKSKNVETLKSESSQLYTVRIGVMTGIIEHYIAVVGQEKDIWKDSGIDLKVNEFSTGVEAIGAVQMNQIDVAEVMDFAIINRLGATSANSNLKIYNVNYETSSDAEDSISINKFYVNPDRIKNKSELSGKRIAVAKGTISEYLVDKVLEKSNLTSKDITEVPLESITDTIAVASNDEIDAVWVSGTAAEKLIKLGWKPLYDSISLNLITRDFGVTSEIFAQDVALEQYIFARNKVIDFINNNIDESIDIIYKKTNISKDIIRSTISSNNLQPTFSNETVSSLNSIKSWELDNGKFDSNFELRDFIDTTALKNDFPNRVTYNNK